MDLITLLKTVKKASQSLLTTKAKKIDLALLGVADALISKKEFLKQENAKDVFNARENGKSDAFIDRLTLTDSVINSMAEGVRQIAGLKSPVFKTIYKYSLFINQSSTRNY